MPSIDSGNARASIVVTVLPQSPPCAPNFGYPSTDVISSCHNFAVVGGPIGDAGFDENPNPGIDGTTTSNASSADPPTLAGSVSGPMTSWNSSTDPGQPCVSTIGIGRGPFPSRDRSARRIR